jgi:haloalkane dehalogenase
VAFVPSWFIIRPRTSSRTADQPIRADGYADPVSETTWRDRKRKVEVDGLSMAYVEEGAGDPIVLLHGNPTSSYLWRNVIPHVEPLGRCIAPDLIGMGDSDPLPDSGPGRYRFVDHRRCLDGLLEALDVRENVTFVVHDWGSALGFDWANRHRDAVAGLAYMEAIVRPVTWAQWPDAARRVFQGFRSEAGESMVLERNVFVEAVLPGSVLRKLTDEEMAEYRRPFLEPGERRRPTLTWPREIPIEGEPADVTEIVSGYSGWLSASPVPKLFVNAEPGAILTGEQREFCRTWPNQREVTVRGSHFVQEDSPDEIGTAIAEWLPSISR